MFLPSFASSLPTRPQTSEDIINVLPDSSVTKRLIELLLERAGLSQAECARRMGVETQSLHQYKKYRANPSVRWLARFVQTCGGRLIIELPERQLGYLPGAEASPQGDGDPGLAALKSEGSLIKGDK